MAAYEYRLTATPRAIPEMGWDIKVWCREFCDDPDRTGWKCVYDQAMKYKLDGRFPNLYWKAIVKYIVT